MIGRVRNVVFVLLVWVLIVYGHDSNYDNDPFSIDITSIHDDLIRDIMNIKEKDVDKLAPIPLSVESEWYESDEEGRNDHNNDGDDVFTQEDEQDRDSTYAFSEDTKEESEKSTGKGFSSWVKKATSKEGLSTLIKKSKEKANKMREKAKEKAKVIVEQANKLSSNRTANLASVVKHKVRKALSKIRHVISKKVVALFRGPRRKQLLLAVKNAMLKVVKFAHKALVFLATTVYKAVLKYIPPLVYKIVFGKLNSKYYIKRSWARSGGRFAKKTFIKLMKYVWKKVLLPVLHSVKKAMRGFAINVVGRARDILDAIVLKVEHWGRPVVGGKKGKQKEKTSSKKAKSKSKNKMFLIEQSVTLTTRSRSSGDSGNGSDAKKEDKKKDNKPKPPKRDEKEKTVLQWTGLLKKVTPKAIEKKGAKDAKKVVEEANVKAEKIETKSKRSWKDMLRKRVEVASGKIVKKGKQMLEKVKKLVKKLMNSPKVKKLKQRMKNAIKKAIDRMKRWLKAKVKQKKKVLLVGTRTKKSIPRKVYSAVFKKVNSYSLIPKSFAASAGKRASKSAKSSLKKAFKKINKKIDEVGGPQKAKEQEKKVPGLVQKSVADMISKMKMDFKNYVQKKADEKVKAMKSSVVKSVGNVGGKSSKKNK